MQKNNQTNLLLISILILAFIARVYHLDKFGIWYDEKGTILSANGITAGEPFASTNVFTVHDYKNYKNITSAIKANNFTDSGNSVFYVALMYYWSGLFGNSDFNIRLLSVLVSIATLLLMFILLKKAGAGNNQALFAVFIFSFHPMIIEFSREARGYSLAVFFTLLSSLYFIKIRHSISNNLPLIYQGIVYGVVCSLALLSHYFTFYIIFPQTVLLFFICFRNKRYYSAFMPGLLILLIMLLWLLTYGLDGSKLMAVRNARILNIIYKTDETVMTTPVSLVKATLQWLAFTIGTNLQDMEFRLRQYWPLMVMPWIVIILARILNFRKADNLTILCSLGFMAFFFNLFLAINSGHLTSFLPKYSIFSVPYLIICLCASIFKLLELNFLKKLLCISTVVTLVSCYMIQFYFFVHLNKKNKNFYPDGRKENPYQEVAVLINSSQLSGDTIIFGDWRDAELTNLYLPSENNNMQMVDTLYIDKIILKNNSTIRSIYNFSGKHFKY